MALSQLKTITNLKLFSKKPLKKFKSKDQVLFLKTLQGLLAEGFSINQSLIFMELLMPRYQHLIHDMVKYLEQGYGIERGLREVGYPLTIVAQLFYGQRQGRFLASMENCIDQMTQKQSSFKQMTKALTYPIIMFVFLLALLIGMRSFLLPHIVSFISQEVYDDNVMVKVLVLFFSYLPQILTGIIGFFLSLILLADIFVKKSSYIKRCQTLLKIPVIKKWIRYYCTYKTAQSLGYFLEGGFSILQTIELIVMYPIDPFLSEIAQEINGSLLKGEDLTKSLVDIGIFQPEFSMIIMQGELISQLATKLLMYADNLRRRLLEDMARKINFLQPFMFLLIAILIMSMYLLMMLPMLTMETL